MNENPGECIQIDPISLFLALVAGIITSLLPGLHPNTIGAILTPYFGGNDAWPLVLIAMLGVRVALQFLPSILVGVPEGDTQISLLPGQRMKKDGRGLEAMGICAFSAVAATTLAILISPLMIPVLPGMFAAVAPWTGWLLLAATIALLADERLGRKIALACVVFLLAGGLGILASNRPLIDPLFALFVGFFTMPALLHGEKIGGGDDEEEDGEGTGKENDGGAGKLDMQERHGVHIPPILPYILLGVLLGGLADLLPGLSTPAQIAVFATLILPLNEPASFLALVAAIEASHTAFALTSSATVGVARVGVVAMVASISPIRPESLPLLMGVFALSVGVGAMALLWLGRRAMMHWSSIDWTSLARLLAAYLVLVIYLNDGVPGLIVLASATAIGMLPGAWHVRRTHVMGALILPAMLHAFGLI